MANKYWISTASGSWNTATNWSPSGVPAATDIVYFNAAFGTSSTTVTIGASSFAGGLDCTGFPGTIEIRSGFALTVTGNVTLSASTTAQYTGAGTLLIKSTTTVPSPTVTANGASLKYAFVRFSGNSPANIFTLVGALNCTNTFAATTCTVNFNGNVITCGFFGSSAIAVGTVVYDFGGSGTSEIVVTGGGVANNTVVDLSRGVSCTSSVSGSQRPVIRLTYNGAAGNRKVVDQRGAFDYIFSGSDPISLTLTCINLNLSGYTGTATMTTAMGIAGDLTFSSAAAKTKWASPSNFGIVFNGIGTQNINTQGVALGCPVTFAGTGPYVIANSMSMGLGVSQLVTLTTGTLNLNGKTLTVTNFSSSGSATRGVTFASGKIVTTGTTSAWLVTVGSGLTITGPGEIELKSTTTGTRVFTGGSVAYNGITLIISGAATGNNTAIRGSNSFYSMINTISPQTIWFDPSSVTIFTDDFQLNGTAGKNITISSQTAFSTLAAAPKFAKPSGNVVCSYANIVWNTAGYASGPTAAYTSTWTTGVGSVLTPNQTSGWAKSAGTAGFITFFYP